MRDIVEGDFIADCPNCKKVNPIDNGKMNEILNCGAVGIYYCGHCGHDYEFVVEKVSSSKAHVFFKMSELRQHRR